MLGVDAPAGATPTATTWPSPAGYWESLPRPVRDHLHCPVVDELTPITQKHTIEGLVMGEAD